MLIDAKPQSSAVTPPSIEEEGEESICVVVNNDQQREEDDEELAAIQQVNPIIYLLVDLEIYFLSAIVQKSFQIPKKMKTIITRILIISGMRSRSKLRKLVRLKSSKLQIERTITRRLFFNLLPPKTHLSARPMKPRPVQVNVDAGCSVNVYTRMHGVKW
jgi:hypothetical protein